MVHRFRRRGGGLDRFWRNRTFGWVGAELVDQVAQLANVSRPRPSLQVLDGVAGERQRPRLPGREVCNESRDIRAMVLKRGDLQLEDSQAVVEILAEATV